MSPVIPPSLIEAARSGDVRGANLAVYIELHEWLDADEYRTVTAWWIADRLKMSARRVYQALDKLHGCGYLAEGKKLGKARTFRLTAPRSRAVQVLECNGLHIS